MTGPHYEDGTVTVHHGDCLDVLAAMPDASVDAVVTDPPYGLAFMGKQWDDHVDGRKFQQWCELWAAQCLRVLKPGGHMLAFGGTRTWHRLACAIEDAGFEVRDSIAWLYGSGFPKSLDVSKAIDKVAGATREVIGNTAEMSGRTIGLGVSAAGGYEGGPIISGHCRDITAPATSAAQQWQGWGTALKPAFEPVVVARKPLVGTVAANVLAYGTGALNIDGCRVGTSGATTKKNQRPGTTDSVNAYGSGLNGGGPTPIAAGRWPANVVLDGHTADHLNEQSGISKSPRTYTRGANVGPGLYDGSVVKAMGDDAVNYADTGGASRFFPVFRYQAKAPTDERPRNGDDAHPTVKPLDLLRWLVRLVTPPGGTVLDPFAGTGTTGEACIIEGARCVLIEREPGYLPLIRARLNKPIQPDLFGGLG